MAIDIYMFKMSPPCRAVLMTAKELNIELNQKLIDVSKEEQFTPEYLKMNPLHTIPTIVDNGFILWESRAILQYLCNQYAPNSPLYPKEPKKRAIIDRWLDFDMTLINSIKEGVLIKFMLDLDPQPEKVNSVKNNLKVLDQLIGDNKYLTGNELTIADIAVLASTSVLEFSYDLTDYPNFKRWFTSLQKELPYFDEINKFSLEEIMESKEKNKEYFLRKVNE